MFSTTSLSSSSSVNGIRGSMVDGTINPAALNSSAAAYGDSSNLHAPSSPRGTKRNRPQESEHDLNAGSVSTEDPQAKRRGKAQKSKNGDDDPTSHAIHHGLDNGSEQLRTPVSQPSLLPQETKTSPNQASPAPTAPSKPVLKALPTVRDHTTDTLTPEGDEYVPREFDDSGEKKVNPQGHLMDGRTYRMRVFYVPNRGEKLFMLATECARVLNYRDSYLLFNKNRSLFKIIATQAEKDELIHQEILPYSYRSRQIAIVTAKSMFRQFGARVIVDGRRVKDDYWEAKARKQGFTEEDMAGEKRPGGSKARGEMEAAHVHPEPPITGRPEIVYTNTMPLMNQPIPALPMPMQMIQTEPRDFGNVPRNKMEVTAPPYQDHTQRSFENDILHQASNAAENNKAINQQRAARSKLYEESWNRPHESPVQTPRQKVESSPIVSQSQNLPSNALMNPNSTSVLPQHLPGPVSSNPFPPPRPGSHAPSPSRHQMPSQLQQHAPQNRSAYNPNQHPPPPQHSPYGFNTGQSNQMWGHPPPQPNTQQPPPHPQPSPMSPHHPSLPNYSPSPHPSQSPLHQQHPPPQSPHPQQQPQQMHHSQSSGSMPANMPYQPMAGMPRGGPAAAYGGMNAGRNIWTPQQQPQQQPQPGHPGAPNPHQQQDYLGQMTGAGQAGQSQGWAPPPGPQGHQWGGYPVSSGF